MNYLMILLVFGIFLFFSQNADALMIIDDPAKSADVIVVGTIVSASPNYNTLETEYKVDIEEIVKGLSNETQKIYFTSFGIDDPQIELRRTINYKIFSVGDRTLLLLYEKNGRLEHGLSVINSFCNADQMMQLYYVPAAGLVLNQNGSTTPPFHTNEPITAQFYYYNKNLTESQRDVKIQISGNFPDMSHIKTDTLDLERCQAYAMTETQFVMEHAGTVAISVDTDLGGMAVSGIKVIDYFPSPLKQIKNGIALIDVECKEGKHVVYKRDRMRAACVTPDTENHLILERGWGLLRLGLPASSHTDLSHGLCNYYDGYWYPKYLGCQDVTDFQCSLMGGQFVDNLNVCHDKTCSENNSLCVTNSNLLLQYPNETEEQFHNRCGPSETLRGPVPPPSECESDLIECTFVCGNDDKWLLFDEHGFEIDQETANMIVKQNEN